MPEQPKNSRRVAAGRKNWLKRKGLTPEGRAHLREAACRDKPWLHATGPKTPKGKARSALNGQRRQRGLRSAREIRRDLATIAELVHDLRTLRTLAAKT
jgi:hypothetical protein